MKKPDWRTVHPKAKKTKVSANVQQWINEAVIQHNPPRLASKWVQNALLEKMKREGWLQKPDWMPDYDWNEITSNLE